MQVMVTLKRNAKHTKYTTKVDQQTHGTDVLNCAPPLITSIYPSRCKVSLWINFFVEYVVCLAFLFTKYHPSHKETSIVSFLANTWGILAMHEIRRGFLAQSNSLKGFSTADVMFKGIFCIFPFNSLKSVSSAMILLTYLKMISIRQRMLIFSKSFFSFCTSAG